MQCDATKLKLSEWLDGVLSAEEAADVQRHLDSCAECREELELLREAINCLKEAPLPNPPEDLFERVRAAVDEVAGENTLAPSTSPRRNLLFFPQLRAVAAILLVGVCCVYLVRQQLKRAPTEAYDPELVAPADTKPATAPPEDEEKLQDDKIVFEGEMEEAESSDPARAGAELQEVAMGAAAPVDAVEAPEVDAEENMEIAPVPAPLPEPALEMTPRAAKTRRADGVIGEAALKKVPPPAGRRAETEGSIWNASERSLEAVEARATPAPPESDVAADEVVAVEPRPAEIVVQRSRVAPAATAPKAMAAREVAPGMPARTSLKEESVVRTTRAQLVLGNYDLTVATDKPEKLREFLNPYLAEGEEEKVRRKDRDTADRGAAFEQSGADTMTNVSNAVLTLSLPVEEAGAIIARMNAWGRVVRKPMAAARVPSKSVARHHDPSTNRQQTVTVTITIVPAATP